ncbi:DUF2189 domain-containing protein [Psychromonas ossibalaenae]|uniref:DUF2189 domain-containing protein n=1 Tax=Psychromonas ossibalaenae TaxID=444922 RepID=UPI0004773A37|nr:DUF2189 domain-containing protein [Psychromonas ossibalaenae]
MSTSHAVQSHTKRYARTIECNKMNVFAPFHWLSLAVDDFFATPFISIGYGLIFSIIPFAVLQLFSTEANPMFLIPMVVGLTLIGPVFSSALYDVAWELEKGHRPSFSHSYKSLLRNKVGLWGFAVILLLLLTLWILLAGLVFALYPSASEPTLIELSAFLGLGSIIGGILLVVVLVISAFTPQVIMERQVDIMTAVFSSANAVKNNLVVMCVWGAIILTAVAVGFLTSAIAFIVIMPLLSFASWHAYIAVIKTKKPRTFE